VDGLSDEALARMTEYSWPGNVRELINVLERAILISEDSLITLSDLPESINSHEPFQSESLEKKLSIEEYTKAFIRRYQNEYGEQQLAQMLGITRKSLWEKRKKWGIPRN
jgi:transcriptional regulator with PAS, ATPase and Fis domain